jgi:acyl-CoA synthetase (NDP forming)
MKLFFEPEKVALIGASSNIMRPGYHLFYNMNVCFGENFYPVNPRVEKIDNKNVYKSIMDVPADIDVCVIFINASRVPEAIEQCAQKGIRRVIIESAGFAEVGEVGRNLQDRCLAIAKESGMRLWGPNCMGLINVHQTKVLSFLIPFMWQNRFLPGKVSIVVQSGMLSAGFLMHILSRTPFGLSKISSIGNKMDVDEVDIMEYLVSDPETGVIAMYLESMMRGRRLFELARSTAKPVVVLKGGRSALGARAALSHTASLAQDDKVLDAALRHAGVIRVHGMTELLDVARSLAIAAVKPVTKARAAVITFAGSAGVVSSDYMADLGMDFVKGP